MIKVLIKFLQGSGVSQTMLDGLPVCPLVASFLSTVSAENMKKIGLSVDEVIAVKKCKVFVYRSIKSIVLS